MMCSQRFHPIIVEIRVLLQFHLNLFFVSQFDSLIKLHVHFNYVYEKLKPCHISVTFFCSIYIVNFVKYSDFSRALISLDSFGLT